MKLLTYIKYFYFLLDNWDFKVAWYIFKEEVRGEKKYKLNTTGEDELVSLENLGIDTSHATIYMPVSYGLLEQIFEYGRQLDKNHFLDIGCGKGRALCIAAHAGFKKVTGIDFSKTLCEKAVTNLSKTKNQIPEFKFSVINNDAFYFEIPGDVDWIFLFNPFDEIIMSGVINNIFESLENNPRKLRIIYANPVHLELFTKAGYKKIWHNKKLEYIEAVILEN